MKILHLRHNEIDKKRWDKVIANSQCDLPYQYSWWLDEVSPGWEALVSEDYQYLMALPLKKQFGIKYLVHPVWVQQLGIYSEKEITPHIFTIFKKKIPYLVYDFNINYTNLTSQIEKKTNLIIPHNEQIETIRKQYNTNTRRNINKANRASLEIREIEPEIFTELWKRENRDKKELLHQTIDSLIEAATEHQTDEFKAHLFGVFEKGELTAALFGVQTKNRFIYLIPVSNKQGKESSAMFKLVDHIIENLCCREKLLFDCEGSMIPGVARFYHGFGAIEQSYGVIRRCHPAKLINLIHRIM